MAKSKIAHKTKYSAQKYSTEPQQDRIVRIDKAAHPTWKFEQIEIDGDFSLNKCSDLTIRKIILALKGLEGMTWHDIAFATHDSKNKSKHHSINLEKLTKDGKRAYSKKFNDETRPEELFSIALNNLMRLLGYREGSSFYVIWIDPNHDFVATKYSN